nr:MAG TPA: hypothetical protein [Caudoviricetes sp.]
MGYLPYVKNTPLIQERRNYTWQKLKLLII